MSSLVFDTIKILLTAIIIFAVAQLSQRDTLLAAILASIPLVSVLAMRFLKNRMMGWKTHPKTLVFDEITTA